MHTFFHTHSIYIIIALISNRTEIEVLAVSTEVSLFIDYQKMCPCNGSLNIIKNTHFRDD